jgi:alanine racemase
MRIVTETQLELDLDALAHNYKYLSSRLHKNTKIMAVVKAFGYGSDATVIAQTLEELGASYFAVAYAKEGIALRNCRIQTPILVLHPLPANFQSIVDRCLEPAVYSNEMLEAFIDFAEENGLKSYPIHLKFNTGLNRLGFLKSDLPQLLERIEASSAVQIRSIFSHLVASEDPQERNFTLKQLKDFKEIVQQSRSALKNEPFYHTLNTSGILNYPEAQYDVVRTGIGLYGFGNSDIENQNFRPVASLKTVISQIHSVATGESVGYNRAFIADTPMRTATLPLGHADGIPRSYGNGVGWVTIQGEKAPIVGNVCMDMIMVDVTDISCKAGDEVLVFGTNPTAEELSAAIGSIPYELLTAISQRVKRVILPRNKV